MHLQETNHLICHPSIVCRSVLFSALFLLLGVTPAADKIFAQDKSNILNYTDVEVKPVPARGFEFLAASIRYPEFARTGGVGSTILVHVLVDKQGRGQQANIVSGGFAGDEEVLNVVRATEYIPGRHQGQRVPVMMCIAFIFEYRGPSISAKDCSEILDDPSEISNYMEVEQKPVPVGGFEALAASAGYPEIARKAGVEGTVLVRILIDKQGRGHQAQVMQSIGAGCDEEALRIVRTAEYIPGRHQGQRVPVKMYIAINFDYRGPSVSSEPRSDLLDYNDVEVKPVPAQGFEALAASIKYPEIARKAGVEGTVLINLLVDKQGEAQQAYVMKGIGAGCDEEALRIARTTEYNPGRHQGQPVSVIMCAAITFDATGKTSVSLCSR